MPTVQLPDGTTAQFPDGMAPADIQSALDQHFAPPKPPPAPTSNNFQANSPSFTDRLRMMVANSAVGHSLESGLPKVADALNLHPTETVNSPDYQADRDNFISPQYLLPGNPQGAVGNVTKGALRTTGKLLSAPSLATGVAIGATGGLAAPAAAGAGATALAGRLGQAALKGYGAAVGASGVYQGGKKAYGDFSSGNTDQGWQDIGETLPNAALTLPALAKPIEATGDAMQNAGADAMNSYLKAGKKAFKYDHDPGRGVLEEGPSTSVGFSRQSFADKLQTAANSAGAEIPETVQANAGTMVPRTDVASDVDSVIGSKIKTATGPGGDANVADRLKQFGNTFRSDEIPSNQNVDMGGSMSVPDLYAIRSNVDDNINWNRDMDPTEATVNNARREIRTNLAQRLYDAAPDLKAPSQRYGNLATAAKLADDRTMDTNGSLFSPWKMAGAAVTGAGTEALSHSHGLGIGAGLLAGSRELWKVPMLRTGAATGLFQVGRGVSAAGRGLGVLSGRMAVNGGSDDVADEADSAGDQGKADNPVDRSASNPVHTFASSQFYKQGSQPIDVIAPPDERRLGYAGNKGVRVRVKGLLPPPSDPSKDLFRPK